MKATRLTAIAQALGSMQRCMAAGNEEWRTEHEAALEELTNCLPHGSGFAAGSKLNVEASTRNKLVFDTSFHHMDENGYYCGWTEHQVIVTPDFEMGFNLRITGRDTNDIKDLIADEFNEVLGQEVERWAGYPQVEAVVASAWPLAKAEVAMVEMEGGVAE